MEQVFSWLVNQVPSIVILGFFVVWQARTIYQKDKLLLKVSERAIEIATKYQVLGNNNSKEHQEILRNIKDFMDLVKFYHLNKK